MPLSRIAPGTTGELGWVNAAIAYVAGRITGTNPPAVFTTLGRRRGLFRAWLLYSAAMMPFGRLSRQETELVILRVAHLRGCAYEQHHHERIARRVGVNEAQISDIKADTTQAWPPRRYWLIQACSQLVQTRDIDEVTWSHLGKHLHDEEIIELLLLCGHYDSLATALLTLRVQPDSES